MMTKEEIQQRRAFCGKVAGLSTTGQAIKAIALDTLDALEEAHQGMATVVDALKLYRDKYDDVPELAPDLSRIISAFGESTT